MVSNQLLNAVMERLIEQAKKKHPDKEIIKKPKPKEEKKPRKKDAN